VVAIHAALLPTGDVLNYAYPYGGPGSRAVVWDPAAGPFQDVDMSTDIFCSGHSLLPDGRVYVVGGNDYECEFQGRADRHVFDPVAQSWTQLPDMSVGRWYPTNITLGDGRVITVSGLDRNCQTTTVMEIYTPGGDFSVVPEGELYHPLFPRLHLLTSGQVASVGPAQETLIYDPQQPQWHVVTDNTEARWNGTSVLVPGATDTVMIIGGEYWNDLGENIHTATCEIMDFGDPSPQWQPTGSLHHARAHANVVILPDRRVLVIGGGTFDLYGEPVTIPELYDPDTGTWTELPAQVYGRMYHSTALLLPDGRVISAGQDNGPSGDWGEIYKPPYLFRGPRPAISSAPAQIAYGSSFAIETPDAADITAVALLRLGVVTHSVNMEQRYVGLPFSVAGATTLLATAPPDGNHAPPGYYMLFILNGLDVPSEAGIVQVVPATGCIAVSDCADLDGDGIRDDNCVSWSCSAGTCAGTDVAFADLGGPFGACAPDGVADGNDRFHALTCFSNSSTLGAAGYPCEPFPPQAMNVDAGGEFGSCSPDGVCDGHDAFHALNAFDGSTSCSCPAGGPAPGMGAPPGDPVITGEARLRLLASRPRLRAGEVVEVDVMLEGAVGDLRGYQLHAAVTNVEHDAPAAGAAGVDSGDSAGRGGLELVDIAVRPRADAALPAASWQAFNIHTQQMVAGLDGAGVRPSRSAYLATLVFRASPQSRGEFVVGLRHPGSDPAGRTYLFPTPYNGKIEITAVEPAVIEVKGPRPRRDRHGTIERTPMPPHVHAH
jgi:hypothetical protein